MIAATNTNEKAIDSRAYVKRITEPNDRLRQTFCGCKVMTTCGVNELSQDIKARLLGAVVEFDSFDWRHDLHGDHELFFKIDYDNNTMEIRSEEQATPRAGDHAYP